MYTIIKKCRICSSKKLIDILNLRNQTLANNFSKSKKKQKKIPLKLCICSSCKLLQISANVNPSKLFNSYFWVTSTSKGAKNFSKIFSEFILKKINKPNYVLEIASNDGLFLKRFKSKNLKVLGVEPAANLAKFANQKKIKTIKRFFDLNTSKYIKKKFDMPDVIVARNVIPHVKNIKSAIKGIHNLISIDGIVAIEFHYAGKILKQLQYDSIYHEHLFYFSATTIIKSFKRFSLYAFDIDFSPISGGAIIIYFSKKKLNVSKKLKKFLINENLSKINSISSWKLFGKKCVQHSKNLKKIILNLSKEKNPLIGYGASARSSTLLNFMNINNNQILKIVDSNKMKQGTYTSGSNIPIVSLRKISVKSNIIILAWNFLDEILRILKSKKIKGKILVPLPIRSYFEK